MPAPALVWFRQDLRLADNPALLAAQASGRPVIPVYVLDDATPGAKRPGGASRWWLHHSLAALADSLAARGSRLVLRSGPAGPALDALLAETGAEAVYWNRCYAPWAIARDRDLKAALRAAGITVETFNAALLHEPWDVLTGGRGPYKVFSPYERACWARGWPAAPQHAPDRLPAPAAWPASEALDAWQLTPALRPGEPDWAGGLAASWQPGEAGGRARLDAFADGALAGYGEGRNRPDWDGTSRLSPHLHFGEVSPRQVWYRAAATVAGELDAPGGKPVAAFLRQLFWRDFSHSLLYHWPEMVTESWKPAFRAFPWRDDPEGLKAWQAGRTGFPIVDAGMRQLWATGWLHNRLRMIVASFLTKDLLLPWQAGEAWFWDTLVDADLANNVASWQWTAGSGADAAPYFRIFNPVRQGRRFDPEGAYVRRWVPELAALPAEHIHAPWEAPLACEAAGVRLGSSYPRPILDHRVAKDRAMAAYKGLSA